VALVAAVDVVDLVCAATTTSFYGYREIRLNAQARPDRC
jgi:hypothetical protein